MPGRPRGLLFDFGGTLVEEVGFNARAGMEVLLRHAVEPPRASVEQIAERAERISREVSARRDEFGIETPWASLTRLVHDAFGTRFDVALEDLELPFWDAAAVTRPIPGAVEALREFRRLGLPMGVVSNSSFRHHVIRHELTKHGLAEHLAAIVVSAEYSIRKPHPLLFKLAAARLGVACADIWFVGDRLDTDISGAKAAGMTAVWFQPSDATERPDVDLVASTWSDLVRILREVAV